MKRENNYDLLRILSTFAVIMIHVSDSWFSSAVNQITEYNTNIKDIQASFFICFYNSISRFAVPCFIMLSGALIISNSKNAEYKKFYAKTFAKVGVPTVIFSLLYILYRLPFCFWGEEKEIISLLKDILKGSPMYHMWYLYMLIGIYALTPIVIRFKNSITEKTFYKVSFAFLAWASISQYTGMAGLSWDIGQSFEYLGYFMVGYSIRKMFTNKNNCKAIIAILIGAFWIVCASGLVYKEMTARYEIISPYCLFIVLASLFIFIGFTLLDIRKESANLSNLTFYIYLIHAGVWNFISKVFYHAFGKNFLAGLNGAIWIPIFIVIVFSISYLLSKFYLWIWHKLDKEKKITNYLIKKVRLYT